jgi:predicted RNA-binding Zn-ribbon protein involved in translation (DUF1610 family)
LLYNIINNKQPLVSPIAAEYISGNGTEDNNIRSMSMYQKIKVKEIKDKYYCAECKSWFEFPVVHQWKEPRGEYWGIPCDEEMCEWLCPVCGSDEILKASELEVEDDE